MANPFIYVTNVCTSTKNLMRGSENDEAAEKEYKPYLTNRALSYQQDCIFFANELNIHHDLDSRLQYEFLLNSLRKRKRRSQKWEKDKPVESVEMIMEYFGYGRAKAEQALKVLTDDQLTMIELALDKGGKV
jgi:hypothetical protein